ncbi:MAG: endonuclease/exonuclease/phosphatase family protein [Rhodocyclaceae bacterium]|jgi:endonuclease/exonuclease/phosphatase family metal-dependent hydrolase|nr:endonuclease/exonuclease/phosphatase family protein [Rhodocyclaceae bacterium]
MLKVMSFNLRYGLADDRENAWSHRRALALARIRTFDPDLLGLQECLDNDQAEFITTGLPDYQFLGIQRGGEGESAIEMAPLLFRAARFKLVRHGCFWLSDAPGTPGSRGWDGDFPRTATWATLVHLPSARPLVILNTHLDYQPRALQESARMLSGWARQTGATHPLVITGDFNAGKDSPVHRALTTEAGLVDTHRRIHPDCDEITYHGYGQAPDAGPLDWILASKHFTVVDATIDRWHEGPLFPSDHYPLTATLDWKPEPPRS